MSGIIVYWNSFVNLKLIVNRLSITITLEVGTEQLQNPWGGAWEITGTLGWVGTEQLQEPVSLSWAIKWYLRVGSEQLQEPEGGTWTITWSLGWEMNNCRNLGVVLEPLHDLWGWDLNNYRNLGVGPEPLHEL